MSVAKTKKALLKRIKITSTGKVLKRRPGQNHFNAKDSGQKTRQKRGTKTGPKSLHYNVKVLANKYY